MIDPDEAKKPSPQEIVVGADLSKLSVEELEERVGALRAEIARLEADIAVKRSSRAAADSVFRF
jgi:uncharacterized small protein (DUF1192 family)